MVRGKAKRHKAIAGLIRSRSISSQDELAERLAEAGHAVTQATVSRDLEELGAVKVRGPTGVGYALAGEIHSPGLAPPRLAAILGEWVRSIEPAASLIVVKTPPGSAHLVGAALDQAGLPEVVGTVSGDDTVFVAARSASKAAALAARLEDLAFSRNLRAAGP